MHVKQEIIRNNDIYFKTSHKTKGYMLKIWCNPEGNEAADQT